MIQASEIEAALRAALPADQRAHAAALARLLADVANGERTVEAAQRDLTADPTLVALLQLLAGKDITGERALLSFGGGSQFGDITIGDVAGNTIVKLNVSVQTLSPGRLRLLLGLGALAVVVVVALIIVFRPASRSQEAERAKQTIAAEALASIASMDARLGFVQTALAPEGLADPLQQARATVAPGTAQQNASGYQRLIAQQAIASLRQAFNSRPLRAENGRALTQALLDGGADPSDTRFFYDQLAQVDDASESLLATLADISASPDADQNRRKLDLAVKVVQNRSATAHVAGLIVFQKLGVTPPGLDQQLAALRYLEPRRQISAAEAQTLLAGLVEQTQQLVVERQQAFGSAQQQLATVQAAYEGLNQQLIIQPNDKWDLVVAKARSLRDLGRIDEAVAAFARYGELFAASDPGALQYSRTAQQFTVQSAQLQQTGGVYVFQIGKGSAAERVGLAVGDIIVAYNDQPTPDPGAFAQAQANAPTNSSVTITLLRMDAQGRFSRQIVTVPSGALGAGLMPI